MYDISSIYFAYKTNVNVQFEREVKVQMPAVTICANTSYLTKPEFMNQTLVSQSGSSISYLPLGQQLLNATISAQDFFNKCEVMKPISFEDKFTEDYIGCENISKIQESIDYNRKCFTLFSQINDQDDDKFRIDHDIILRDNAFPMYMIYLNNR